MLDAVVRFLQGEGVQTIEELNSHKARELLDHPLWKILEVNGKYGGDLISEGVKELEQKLGRRVSASGGTWPEKALVQLLGPEPAGLRWSRDPRYSCQLEHVNPRAVLIREILQRPNDARAIVQQHLLGCVVLVADHKRLSAVRVETSLEDPWRRYRDCERPVRVWDRERESWLDLAPVG